MKILGKCWENLGKILRESTYFLDKFRSKYQNTLRKTEEAFVLCRYLYFEKMFEKIYLHYENISRKIGTFFVLFALRRF